MKKYLFLIITIFSIFFITDKVSALSMNVNGLETEVTEENFVYYIYSLNKDKFEDYSHFVIFTRTDGRKTLVLTNSHSQYHFALKGNQFWAGTGYFCNYTSSYELVSCSEQTQNQTYFGNFSTSLPFYTSSDIFNYGTEEILYTANITLEDLKKNVQVTKNYKIIYYLNNEIYKEFEVEEGSSHELLTYDFNKNTHTFSGWQYDENIDLTNIMSDITINATLVEKELIPVYIEFPINKNEFYVLLVEVGILIMIIFLKWCFPFKGGSDLR